ncbi:hypothetical protein WUBG_17184, partial [Wuchereria bancrofti]
KRILDKHGVGKFNNNGRILPRHKHHLSAERQPKNDLDALSIQVLANRRLNPLCAERQPKNDLDALSIQVLANRRLNPLCGREVSAQNLGGDILKKENSSFRTATVKDNFQLNLQTKLAGHP